MRVRHPLVQLVLRPVLQPRRIKPLQQPLRAQQRRRSGVGGGGAAGAETGIKTEGPLRMPARAGLAVVMVVVAVVVVVRLLLLPLEGVCVLLSLSSSSYDSTKPIYEQAHPFWWIIGDGAVKSRKVPRSMALARCWLTTS